MRLIVRRDGHRRQLIRLTELRNQVEGDSIERPECLMVPPVSLGLGELELGAQNVRLCLHELRLIISALCLGLHDARLTAKNDELSH